MSFAKPCCFKALVACLLIVSGIAVAAPHEDSRPVTRAVEDLDGRVIVEDGELIFDSWSEYFESDYFRANGMRCATDELAHQWAEAGVELRGSPSDCTYSSTNPSADYDPSVVTYQIPVVVHVLQGSGTPGVSGQGYISSSMIESQIEILNEDYLALTGTPGAPGTDAQIQFYLATEDPSGNPTTGITYTTNATWFNDSGGYYNTLAWDPDRYLNIYTNTASGALGYVPFLPQQCCVGSLSDRVVIHYESFGRNSPGFPYHMGRTATHEVGHYLGLFHTFEGGCASTSGCNSNGDRICDTNPEQQARFNCFGSSCGSSDPFRNYMDYTNDTCMNNFTPEQARRMRCTLEHYRPDLYEVLNLECAASVAVSCKSHTGTGTECVTMNDAGESRTGGIEDLYVVLDEPSAFEGGLTVTCQNAGDVSGSIASAVSDGGGVSISFSPALPNGDACTIDFDCNASICVTSLEGDINDDKGVTTADASSIKAFFGQSASTDPRLDLNLDGVVSTADLSLIKPQFGNTGADCP